MSSINCAVPTTTSALSTTDFSDMGLIFVIEIVSVVAAVSLFWLDHENR